MRRIQFIAVIVILLGSAVIGFRGKYANPVPNNDTTLFATEGIWLLSPSGKYGLSVEKCMDGDVDSLKIIVCGYEHDDYIIKSEKLFRCRDTLLVLWDDTMDRVWAYSGDLGTFYWDIVNFELKISPYSPDNTAEVPFALKTAKPRIYCD